MKRIILTHGAIAGAIIIGSMLMTFGLGDREEFSPPPAWIGYLVMIVALSLIFVGIKRYRDRELGGVIRFKTAFLLGLGISLVASVVYVTVWEVYLAVTDSNFIEVYTRWVIADKQAEGVAGEELEALVARMEGLKAMYAKPISRMLITFLEIFPMGLIMTLISALLLRNSRLLPARTPKAAPARSVESA